MQVFVFIGYSLYTTLTWQKVAVKEISLKPVEFQAECGEFVAHMIVLWFLLVKKIGVNQDRTCALACQWPF